MSKITDPERIIFYEQQKADLFKNGVTTIFGNYFNGEFFQRFFQAIESHHAYALTVHLKSRKTKDRLSFQYVNANTISQQAEYAKLSLNSSLDSLNLLEKLKNSNVSRWIDSNVEAYLSIPYDLFQLNNRRSLEDFLLHLQENYTDYKADECIVGDLEDDKIPKELLILNLQNVIKMCKHFGITDFELIKLVRDTNL